MEVDALDGSRNLVEAYVIETFKTCAADRPNSMVWHQKIFFPAHEQMLFLHPILCDQLWSRGKFGERLVCLEASPMLPVYLLIRTPLWMLCDEGILASNDFALEKCRQAWMVLG